MATTQPNVIVILADDLGYGDLSCMGADFATPHLDRLAAGGTRFTDWYAGSAVCSTSRAALLSGRHPARAGVRAIIAGHRDATGMRTDIPSLAGVLASAGYSTALVGKWHLGSGPGFLPGDHGFQSWFGFLTGCVDYFSHIFYWGQPEGVNPWHDLWEDGREAHHEGTYLTELLSERAGEYVRAQAGGKGPFFLYLAYNAPHYPMHAPQCYVQRFPRLSGARRMTAAMISAMDDGIGAVLDEVDRCGIAGDTIVLFTSDNGPSREARNWLDGRTDRYYGGSAGGFRGYKFSLFEGGIRVPGIIRWPGRVAAGATCSLPATCLDVLPTVATAAGAPVPEGLDGCDILPVLGDAPEPGLAEALASRDLHWELGRQTAIRRGRWKLVLDGQDEEDTPPEGPWLSDLCEDPGERVNRAEVEAALCEEMACAARTWRKWIEADWAADTGVTARGTVSPAGIGR